jgi:hypothetical protein
MKVKMVLKSSYCSLFPYRKSTFDRSAEIKSKKKIGRIEPVPGAKNENE